MRRSLILAFVVLGAALLPLQAQAKTVTIEANEFKFIPPNGQAAVGDTVVFKNTGAAPHNAVASDGSFKTTLINPKSEQSVQISKAGDIAYVCTLHETVGMVATLTVAAAEGPNQGAPPPGSNPSGSDPGGVQVPPTPTAPPTPSGSEAETATDPTASPTAGGEGDTEELAAERPPTQKYFPAIALLMLLALAPMVGMSYRRLLKSGPGGPAEPPEPPAAEA